MKRIAALLLVVILIVPMVGCSVTSAPSATTSSVAVPSASAEAATTPAPAPEKITFTLFINGADARPVDLSATPVGKKITELTGVTLKTEYLVGQGEETKAGLMVAGGDYPDLLMPGNEEHQFTEAQALVPLEGMIEQFGANIKRAYGKDLKKQVDTKDGHTYALAMNRPWCQNTYPGTGFYIAKDVLKQAGYPVVNDINQYFKLIEDYYAKNPTFDGKTVIPFSGETEDWKIYMVTNVPQYLSGHYNTGDRNIDLETYVAHSFQLDKEAHDYFKRLNDMWNRGLIDKEMFMQSSDAFHAKIAQGRVLGFYNERYNISEAIAALEQAGMFDRVPFAVPAVNPGVDHDVYNAITTTKVGGGVCITVSCKQPEAAFKFLDAMCSEPVEKVKWWGIEGVDYTVKDGVMTMDKDQMVRIKDPVYLQNQGILQFLLFPHASFGKDAKYSDGNPVFPRDTEAFISSQYKPYELEVAQAYKVTNLADMMDPPFNSPFGFGNDFTWTDEEMRLKIQNAYDMTKSTVPQLVMCTADQFETLWEQYCTKMKAIPYDAGDQWVTNEMQRRVKEWN